MKTVTKVAWLFVGLGLVGAALSLLVPVPASWEGSTSDFRGPFANSILYATLYVGAAVLFLMGLNAYKAKLRIAYSTIAASIVMAALGVGHFTVLNLFGLLDTAWVLSGGIMLPFLLSGGLAYIGMRSMARQVGVQSVLARFWVVLPLVAAGMFLSNFLPHTSFDSKELYFDLTNMIITFDIILYLICAVLALRARQHMGAHYAPAMAWLTVGFFGTTLLTLTTLMSALLLGPDFGNYVQEAVVLLGGILYLKAGEAFALTKEL